MTCHNNKINKKLRLHPFSEKEIFWKMTWGGGIKLAHLLHSLLDVNEVIPLNEII